MRTEFFVIISETLNGSIRLTFSFCEGRAAEAESVNIFLLRNTLSPTLYDGGVYRLELYADWRACASR